jgi:hypothetical protein
MITAYASVNLGESAMDPADMATHPDGKAWRRYARGGYSQQDARDRLIQHLGSCPECLEVLASLPPRPLKILGRPLTPSMTDFSTCESDIRLLEKLALGRYKEGGIIRVAGDWLSEPAVYHVVSSAFSRLRRRGLYGVVRDGIWNCGNAPNAGNSVIECILQAPNYHNIADWEKPMPGQVRILCGLDEDWSRAGIGVDVCVTEGNPVTAVRHFHDRQIRRIERAWTRDALRPALVAVALGCDVRRASISSPVTRLFVAVGEQTDWYSTEGSWLVWGVLSRKLASGQWALPGGSLFMSGRRRREAALNSRA